MSNYEPNSMFWKIAGTHLAEILTRKKGGNMENEVLLSAKRLLEMDACSAGFRYFVNLYGTQEVLVKTVYDKCKEDGHENYCQWIKDKFPECFKKERTYSIGQRFILRDVCEEYILARIATSKVGLISLKDGNCWNLGREVIYTCNITSEEMTSVFGIGSFKLIGE